VFRENAFGTMALAIFSSEAKDPLFWPHVTLRGGFFIIGAGGMRFLFVRMSMSGKARQRCRASFFAVPAR
jgi:hypothetical protein